MENKRLNEILIEVTNQLSNTTVYAQSNQLEKLMELSQLRKTEARKLIRDYTYQSFLQKKE